MKLNKLILVSILSVFLAGAFVSMARAEEGSASAAQKYGITFPIAELGSCGSLAECKTYCDDPVNRDACVSYAKQKGFYKEQQKSVNEEVLTKAKLALGCTSRESCKALCALKVNYDKCSSFAKNQKIEGGVTEDPKSNETLTKAKEILGCKSITECKSFCSQEQNQAKCTEFAKTAGLRGGEKIEGPGGCSSAASCSTYCSNKEHYTECSKYIKNSTGGLKGPGGCTTEATCREYCTAHPDECANFSAKLNSSAASNTTAAPVVNTAGSSLPTSKEEYCRLYPSKCPTLSTAPLKVSPTLNPTQQALCKQYPDKCATYFQTGSTTTNAGMPPPPGTSPTELNSAPSPVVDSERDTGTQIISPTPIQETTNFTTDVKGAATESLTTWLIKLILFGF